MKYKHWLILNEATGEIVAGPFTSLAATEQEAARNATVSEPMVVLEAVTRFAVPVPVVEKHVLTDAPTLDVPGFRTPSCPSLQSIYESTDSRPSLRTGQL